MECNVAKILSKMAWMEWWEVALFLLRLSNGASVSASNPQQAQVRVFLRGDACSNKSKISRKYLESITCGWAKRSQKVLWILTFTALFLSVHLKCVLVDLRVIGKENVIQTWDITQIYKQQSFSSYENCSNIS